MFSNPFVLSFCLLLSLPILFLLVPRILPPPTPLPPPITLSDEVDDLSLFNRAASSSSSFSRLSSPNPKLKIAFLFLTNSDLHFSPLWNRFFKKADQDLYNIYIHADPTANITLPRGVFNSKLISSKRTYRASPTLVSAARRLLATAILDDPANVYFALLSQHCIPLHSFKYAYHSLITSTTFDFSSLSSESVSEFGVRLKYKSFIEIISKDRRLWKRYVARGRYAMLPEVPFNKFRVGSQFFVLTRKHALLVVKDRTLWKKFRKPCYRADECYPEEHYFPTLLSMQDPNGSTHYTLTRVNWTGSRNGHPYTYKPSEVSPQLIYNLRESNYSESYLFARKFSSDSLRPLMKIADSVIFRD
ncbi:Core-2/I-branching beta-1,6-N-acetylglucosaminyltransferase family protein [Melia azedarach]|uniref:Core-2/I-branching beta-1,6-N-acetylglucosaminyltransferase family protein n=1 Tax=Melia azedarach TaxID=155640 RepID=A0ACC1YMV5_MELAZ|nr:Core-2/I-branching beta-1,6-N-acetylglucosaminyltransferase family protein [Melia azedarach]